MMKNANTEIKSYDGGTCQCCGRAQKSRGISPDAALMAKHGYTVEYGWFNGVCVGAGELPWEISKDVAESFRDSVRDVTVPAIEREIADLRAATRLTYVDLVYMGWSWAGATRKNGARARVEMSVLPGWTTPAGWSFERERERQIKAAGARLESALSYVEMMTEKLAGWKFSPEKLTDANASGAPAPDAEHAELLAWFEGAKAELAKLPASRPDGIGIGKWEKAIGTFSRKDGNLADAVVAQAEWATKQYQARSARNMYIKGRPGHDKFGRINKATLKAAKRAAERVAELIK